MVRQLFFDVISGASGDMILGSLVDLGVPTDYLERELLRLGIPGLSIKGEKTIRGGIACTAMKLDWEPQSTLRHLPQLLSIIEKGNFPTNVFERCTQVLDKLATAESRVHGIPKDHVHFHEVGAVDTIVDIVGVVLGLEYLKVKTVLFSTLTDGYGTIRGAHGVLPVPVPAVAAMLEGFQLTTVDVPTELLTPTGCALLTALGSQTSRIAGTIAKIGYGCGTKVIEQLPNVLRAVLLSGEPGTQEGDMTPQHVITIESDMDHISGEIMGHVAGLLQERGALDVSWAPVFMKKGRPGYHLMVIAREEDRERMIDTVMEHTRTLGLRVQRIERVVAQRHTEKQRLGETEVTAKVCRYKGKEFRKLEYDALAALSREKNLPILDLMEQYLREQL